MKEIDLTGERPLSMRGRGARIHPEKKGGKNVLPLETSHSGLKGGKKEKQRSMSVGKRLLLGKRFREERKVCFTDAPRLSWEENSEERRRKVGPRIVDWG